MITVSGSKFGEYFDAGVGVSESSIAACEDREFLMDKKLLLDQQIREIKIRIYAMKDKGDSKLDPVQFHSANVKKCRLQHLSQCIQRRQSQLKNKDA